MSKIPKKANLLIHWILVSAFGYFVGFVIADGSLGYSNANWTVTVPVGMVVAGILVGFGQWAVLRMQLKKVWMWIPITAIGFPLGLTLGIMVDSWVFPGGETLIMAIVAGLVMGIPQWLVLHKKVENSILWIPASFLSWVIGVTITFEAIDHIEFYNLALAAKVSLLGVILGILFGVSVGIISGVSITLLMGKTNVKKPANSACT